MADKWFFCEACAIYKTHARAFSGRSLDVEYSCLACGHRVRLVDRPCDHEWGKALRILETNYLGDAGTAFAWERKCEKCEVTQDGIQTIVWSDG